MKKSFLLLALLVFIISCKIQPGSDLHNSDGNPDKVYKLRLSPMAGTTYYYTITNGSDFKMEVDDKKIDNENNSTVAVSYGINKDSAVINPAL